MGLLHYLVDLIAAVVCRSLFSSDIFLLSPAFRFRPLCLLHLYGFGGNGIEQMPDSLKVKPNAKIKQFQFVYVPSNFIKLSAVFFVETTPIEFNHRFQYFFLLLSCLILPLPARAEP